VIWIPARARLRVIFVWWCPVILVGGGYTWVENHTNTIVRRDAMKEKDPVSIKILNLPGNPDGCT
jgi:hypothetical protein